MTGKSSCKYLYIKLAVSNSSNCIDANLPLFGEFRRFCCQKCHFCESPKSVEKIWGGMIGGWGCTLHIRAFFY